MKNKTRKVYKFKTKDLETLVLKDIIKYFKWKGAYMVFPWVEIYKGKRIYGKTEVRLDIKHYAD